MAFKCCVTPSASLDNAEDGGAIRISSTSGDISTQDLNSSSVSYSGKSSNGGSISISSTSGDISTQNLNSRTFSRNDANGSRVDANGSRIHANGGSISISSTSGDISTQVLRSSSYSFSDSGDSGNGGAITISSTSGDISTQDLNSYSYSYSGDSENGGAISISSISGDISTRDSSSYSYSGDSGNGGAISISSYSGDISTLFLDSSSYSGEGDSGNGGDLSVVSTLGNISIFDTFTSFSLAANNSKEGGDISIIAEEGDILRSEPPSRAISAISNFSQITEDGEIIPPNSARMEVGSFVEDENFLLFSGSISLAGKITGNGGAIVLHSDNISELTVITLATGGESGDVDIRSSSNGLIVSDLSIVTTAQVEISHPRYRGQTISIDLRNIGQSGNTFLSSADGIVLNNINIQGNANGNQSAGNITITSPGQVTFNNSQISSNATSSGAAGNIRIDAARLNLGEGDRLLATTSASGAGGAITVNTTESVSLGEGVQDSAPIISVEASGAGKPGNIVINTPNFVLSETARITATTTATATNLDGGGSIDLNANQMDLAGTVGIFAETQGEASGGILTLQPYQANLNTPAESQPQSSGISSDVLLSSDSSFDLTLAENSVISASTTSSGNGGDLQLMAPDAITISGPGRLAVETSGSGQAGDVTATARSLTLADGVVLSASTRGEGNAGNINFNISDQLTIDDSTVESRTFPDSTGQGGNINVNDTDQVSLLNRGNVTLDSAGTGEGGDFTLSADTFTLDSGQITATTQSSNGGDFIFDLDDYLLLRNGSLISTEAGIAGEDGNGGSITINTPDGFVIALPDENSDIRANAFEGNGGTVNITARNLLGIAFRPDISDTPSSDITSSSQFGNSGIVTIDELNTETLQPENELPVETRPP